MRNIFLFICISLLASLSYASDLHRASPEKYIGKSTKIVDRKTGEITTGEVKQGSVVVPGSLPDKDDPKKPSLYCVVVIKKVDEKTRSKTSINELLRD